MLTKSFDTVSALAGSIQDFPPVLLFAVAALPLFALLWLPGAAPARTIGATDRFLMILIAMLCMGVITGAAAYYASTNVLLDHVEPTFIATSALWSQGHPIYHAANSAWRYALAYGPDAYLIDAAAQKALGASIITTKIPHAACVILSLIILFVVFKRESRAAVAWIACGYCALGLAFFGSTAYWGRGDPYLVFFICLGLAGIRCQSRVVVVLLCGIALGICADLKIHAVLYFFPLLAMVYRDHGLKSALATVVLGVVAAAFPFEVVHGISLPDYVEVLKLATKHKILTDSFLTMFAWAAMLALPCVIAAISFFQADSRAFKDWRDENRSVIWAFGIGVALIILVASKEGAGPHHLAPFAPIFSYLFCRLLAEHPASLSGGAEGRLVESLVGGYLIAALLAIFSSQYTVVSIVRDHIPAADAAIAEIREIESRYPNKTIAMGFSLEKYSSTFYRVNLVFDHNPYPVDAAALMDMEESGLHLPPATLEALLAGSTQLWLFPASQEPFSLLNFYSSRQLFSPEFQRIFFENYQKREHGKVFDIWEYRSK